MKIKVINKTYNEVINTKPKKLKKPIKPNIFWRTLIKVISDVSLKLDELGYIVDVEELDKIDSVTIANIAIEIISNDTNKKLQLKTKH